MTTDWKPSDDFDWLEDADINKDELINWEKVDLNDPRLDSVKNQLERTVALIEYLMIKIEKGESSLPPEELEEKKITLNAALMTNRVLLDAANKVISVRNLMK